MNQQSTAYIYDAATRVVRVKVIASNGNVALRRALDEGYDADQFGVTLSPAFGAVDGLIDNPDAEIIHTRAEQCADSPQLWAEYIDPDNTTPFDSISRAERISLALEVIQANK